MEERCVEKANGGSFTRTTRKKGRRRRTTTIETQHLQPGEPGVFPEALRSIALSALHSADAMRWKKKEILKPFSAGKLTQGYTFGPRPWPKNPAPV
jgi:hypothetical protein